VVLAPVAFTAGWVWSGHRTPDVPHATRSVSALSAVGQPCAGPVLAGQAAQGVAQLVNAALALRAGHRLLAAALAASGVGTLVTTAVPLPREPEQVWRSRAHTWSSGVGMAAFHLAPLAGALDPRLPSRTRAAGAASLVVALPATAYFCHRLARHAGAGTLYGWAERTFLTALLAWSTSLPAAYGQVDDAPPPTRRVPLTG
jgi:hypothetical protein